MKVIVVGGGPAGLAAALECLKLGNEVHLLEKEKAVGGISRTIWLNGYGFDIGGHRFFTRSGEVMDLWQSTLDGDFLERPRCSSIFYRGRYFHYPIELADVLKKSTPGEIGAMVRDCLLARLSPLRPEDSFERWVVNRFGRTLYESFFKSYTEKVWGIPCSEISSEWAEQRIRGLSLVSVLKSSLAGQSNVKTLIRSFHYPARGPGQMYEKMAGDIVRRGGKIYLDSVAGRFQSAGGRITGVSVKAGGRTRTVEGDVFISSMPVDELAAALAPQAGHGAPQAAGNLRYRGLITVNLIYRETFSFAENWLYLHGDGVRAARLQYPYRWSERMVPPGSGHSLSMEYFSTVGDCLWGLADEELVEAAVADLASLGLVQSRPAGWGVVRVAKAYPVYGPGYRESLAAVKDFLAGFSNLCTVGRSGQFRYNNMDHSILTGLYGARRINGLAYREWDVNTGQDYHEGEA